MNLVPLPHPHPCTQAGRFMVPCPHPTPPPSRPPSGDKASQGHWNANVWEPCCRAGPKAGGAGATRDPTGALCPSSPLRPTLPGWLCDLGQVPEPQLIHWRIRRESLICFRWISGCLREGSAYGGQSYSLPTTRMVEKTLWPWQWGHCGEGVREFG